MRLALGNAVLEDLPPALGWQQVEQLRAGRDRLLEALSVAQASLDTAMKDLIDSVPEARSAAERAGPLAADALSIDSRHRDGDRGRSATGFV